MGLSKIGRGSEEVVEMFAGGFEVLGCGQALEALCALSVDNATEGLT